MRFKMVEMASLGKVFLIAIPFIWEWPFQGPGPQTLV